MKKATDLIKIIEDNPDCKITIDNDCWWITTKDGKTDLASAGYYDFYSNTYDETHEYGQGILHVFMLMLNARGFNITMQPV